VADFGGDKVFIEVTPSFRGALASIIAESRKWGTDGGKAYKEAFEAQIRGLGSGPGGGGVGPGAAGARQQGNTSGGAYADAFRRRIEAATKALPPVRIGLATSQAESDLRDLRNDLESLSGKTVGVDIDAAAAAAELERIKTQLTGLAANSPDIRVRVDAAASIAQLAALQAEIKRLDGQDVDIDVDTSSAANAIRRLNQTLDGASINTYSGRLLLLGSAGAALAPAIVPAAAAAAVAIVGIGAAISAALAGVGVLALGLSGIGEAVSAMGKAQTEASKNAVKASQQQSGAASTAANSARQIESAEASLANTRATNAASAQRSAQAVADAQASVAEATEDGAKRIRDAQQAAAEAAEDGAQRVADAEEALTRVIDDNSRRISDARRAVADATARATDTIQSALTRYASAERSLADAQDSALRAQESLNDARRQAAVDAEDLALDVVSAGLRQRDAALGVEAAQLRLNETLADPEATDLQKRQARLAYEQQVQQLAEIGVRYKRLQAEKAASDKAGIDGSDRVIDAQERVSDAAQKQVDAQAALATAAAGVADARADAAQSVADAEERLTRTVQDASLAQSDATRRVRDAFAEAGEAQGEAASRLAEVTAEAAQSRTEAEQGVADALTAQAEQQRQAAFSVEQAQRSLQGAYASSAAGGAAAFVGATAGADALAESMGKLSPAGQTFATFLFDILPQLKELKAAAEAGLLPGLQTAIETLLPSIPALSGFIGELGGVLGDLAISAAEALTGPAFADFFDYMSREGGDILTKTAEGFGGILLGVANLMVAFEPLTDIFITGFANMGESFANWADDLQGNESFQGFVDYFKENLPVLQEFFGRLGDAIVTIIESMAPMGPVVLEIVGGILAFVAALPPGVLQAIVLSVVGIVGALTVLGPIIAFVASVAAGLAGGLGIVGAVIAALGGPVTLIIVGVVALGAALVAAYQHSETFRDIVKGVVSFFTDTVGPALSRFFDFIVEYVTVIVPTAFNVGVAYIKDKWSQLTGILDAVWQLVISKVLLPIATYVTVTIPTWFVTAVNLVRAAWAVLETAIGAVWNAVVSNVLAPIATYVTVTIPGWFTTAVALVRTAWAVIGTAIGGVWSGVQASVFEPIRSFIIDTVPGWFRTGVDAIRTVWSLIQDAAKNPVKFVVETVFNNGIRPAFNRLARIVPGIDEIEPFTLPKGFARGGILPGSSSWRDGDDQLRPMRRGEGVAVSEAMVVPEARQQLLTWNRIAMQGGPSAVQAYMRAGGSPGFATGGIVGRATDAITSGASKLRELIGDPAGVFRKIIEDLIGDVPGGSKGIGKVIAGIPGQLVNGLAGVLSNAIGKDDDGATGSLPTPPSGSGSGSAWQAQVVRAMFPSAQITSGFRPGSITASGNLSYHARGRAVDIAPPNMGIFNGLAAAFPNTAELIYSPAGARQLKNGKSHVYTGAVKQMHYNHVHWAYDQGGYLPPGVTQVYNGTGKPEPVFTSQQFADMRAAGAGGLGGKSSALLMEQNAILRAQNGLLEQQAGVMSDAVRSGFREQASAVRSMQRSGVRS